MPAWDSLNETLWDALTETTWDSLTATALLETDAGEATVSATTAALPELLWTGIGDVAADGPADWLLIGNPPASTGRLYVRVLPLHAKSTTAFYPLEIGEVVAFGKSGGQITAVYAYKESGQTVTAKITPIKR